MRRGRGKEIAVADETGAREAVEHARELRDALHRLFLAVATKGCPATDDLKQLQRAYAQAITSATLAPSDQHVAWNWQPDTPHLEQPLWPVAHSAIDLLTAGNLRRIKVCQNPYGCGWLFYDASKNASRRWCSMEGCGSQVKMRRQYAKRRATASA